MLLVSSFHRWHWIVGLVLTLVLSPIAVTADCFESTTDEVILSGSCSKANTTLFIKNPEQSLDFKLDAKKGGTLTQQQIKLAIGKCEFTGEVIYGGPSNSIRLSGNPAPSFELPANAKADSNGITFNGVQNKVATCSSKFEQAKDGYKVSIVYDSKDVILPDFKIMFENAQIYDPPIDKADWSYKGWRLWTVLGSIAAGLLIVVTIITFVVIKVLKNKRKSQFEGGCQTENKSSTAKSTVKSKSIWKKNKSKSAEKSAAKVVDKNEWLKTFVWPLEYTTEVIDMMLVRFDVPNAPIRQVLQMHPMTAAQQDAFNRWSTKHYKVCAVRLTPELYNRLMAECRVINNFVDMGKKDGLGTLEASRIDRYFDYVDWEDEETREPVWLVVAAKFIFWSLVTPHIAIAIVMLSLAIGLSILVICSAAVHKTSYYSSDRRLECVNHGLNITRCSLHEEGRFAEQNPGCFDELDEKNETRVYCRLNCEESDEATVLAKQPNNNHECNNYFNYHIERRRRDWYLWRSGRCLTSTIAFEIRCGFPSDPRQFYEQNKNLFEYEDAPSGVVELDEDVERLLKSRS